MSFETIPERLYDLKPVVSSSISLDTSIPGLISHLKSAFREKDFSLVQRILIDREKQLRTENETLKRSFDSVKKELDLAERSKALADLEILKVKEQLKEADLEILKIKEQLKKAEETARAFNDVEGRLSRLEEELAKKRDEDVSVIPKMLEDLQVSGTDSTGNESRKSGEEGSGNMDFVAKKMTLANSPDRQPLHSMPPACGSALKKEKCISTEAVLLPINSASENRAATVDQLAGDCTKNNLNVVSSRAGSSAPIHISDSDEENKMARVSNGCGVGRNLTSPHQIKQEGAKVSSTSLSKRKRSLSESDNDDGSSFGKQKPSSIQELDRDGKKSFVNNISPKSVFIRRCDDKDGGKLCTPLSSRRSDEYKLNGISDDSSSDSDDPCSDKNMEMLLKRIRESKKWLLEDGLRSSFEKDPELCMNAVCALYRQQVSPNISSKGLSFTKSQWLSQSDKFSITALGEYLIDGDPENKLRKAVAEVRAKDHAECKRLATTYCHQLHQIYLSKVDPLFRPGAIFSKF